MKKQLTIIFIFFLNSSFHMNGSITEKPYSSIFDLIKKDLFNKYLEKKSNDVTKAEQKANNQAEQKQASDNSIETEKKTSGNFIEVGGVYILSANFSDIEIKLIKDNYQKNRLKENENFRIPLSLEDIFGPLEEDQIVLPIKDKDDTSRYALCEIILSKNRTEETKLSNTSFSSNSSSSNSFQSNNNSPTNSNSSSNIFSQSKQPNNNSSKNSSFLRRKSLNKYIEDGYKHENQA